MADRAAGGDTIFAVASGQARTAICVVRLGGPGCGGVLGAILAGPLPAARRLSRRTLRSPATGEVLDRAMVVWMPGPSTFTGEDQAELHLHGGLAVRAAVLRALAGCPSCRPAEPGEFTRRAFLNGRLDLTAVEGLADLIDAETEAQRRQALRQLDGVLAGQAERWRGRLLDVSALCEAGLDFADEGDVPAEVAAPVLAAIGEVRDEIASALAGSGRGERIRDGFVVVIAGAPNAGKSTLLNAIARRDVAIVSPIPGTTRDAIELRCDIDGRAVVFVDTAGLRESADPLEREGMARAARRMASADLVLWLSALDDPGTDAGPEPGAAAAAWRRVWTKADVAPAPAVPDDASVVVSALTGQGLPRLMDLVGSEADRRLGDGGDALVTRERHRVALAETVDCLDRAVVAAQDDRQELVAEDVRLALRALGRLAGRVDVEDVLDRIFSAFCVGK